jgi:hypothetical protein
MAKGHILLKLYEQISLTWDGKVFLIQNFHDDSWTIRRTWKVIIPSKSNKPNKKRNRITASKKRRITRIWSRLWVTEFVYYGWRQWLKAEKQIQKWWQT